MDRDDEASLYIAKGKPGFVIEDGIERAVKFLLG